ncbi:MAG: aminotransferase class V-fold PLP-dependent enzyme [Oscillospiraceae bacterium]|jgi:cysteine desulfurase family protein|nr:aminotransferase class V-fold PLP-dependent enzyme [Oscillospiraceae bacterium]
MIYFDNAATTLHKPPEVAAAMQWAAGNLGSPGRGGHDYAKNAGEAAFALRELASKYFNVGSSERVVITSNATHALNIAINALAQKGKRAVISGYEHNSVYRPVMNSGMSVTIAQGQLFDAEDTLEAFDAALKRDTALCVVNHVSNVFGYIQPIEQIAELCAARGIPLVIDASQSAGAIALDFSALGAEYVAMPGHKGLYGPQGTGLLLCKDARGMSPFLYGGSGSNSKQVDMPDYTPDRLEAGTHNMPGIAGLYEGLRFVIGLESGSPGRIAKHENNLLNTAADGLSKISGVTLYRADDSAVQSGVLSFNIAGKDCEAAAEELNCLGAAVRAGMHCAPMAHKSAGTYKTGTIRASFGVYNTAEEAKRFAELAAMLVNS